MSAQIGAVVVVASMAGAAVGQTMQFSWDLNGTGSNEIVIAPSEEVNLRLYVSMAPGAVGFASAIYDILGITGWDTGTIALYDNRFDADSDDGDLQPNNDILNIESSQPAPFFNPNFDGGNPLWLYEIQWVPDDYTARTIRVTDANHVIGSVYTDDFGSTLQYEILPSEGATIHIIPAPGAMGLAVIGAGVLACRRTR